LEINPGAPRRHVGLEINLGAPRRPGPSCVQTGLVIQADHVYSGANPGAQRPSTLGPQAPCTPLCEIQNALSQNTN
jgi:hypothetical protein